MKYFSWVCCVIWIGFILYNGSQSSEVSIGNSNVIVDYVIEKTEPKKDLDLNSGEELSTVDNESLTWKEWHYLIRKGAHFFEYFLLAVLIGWVGSYYHIRRIDVIVYALFGVLLCAVGDEFIQSFVGRTSSVRDVVLDFVGGGIGVLSCCLVNRGR